MIFIWATEQRSKININLHAWRACKQSTYVSQTHNSIYEEQLNSIQHTLSLQRGNSKSCQCCFILSFMLLFRRACISPTFTPHFPKPASAIRVCTTRQFLCSSHNKHHIPTRRYHLLPLPVLQERDDHLDEPSKQANESRPTTMPLSYIHALHTWQISPPIQTFVPSTSRCTILKTRRVRCKGSSGDIKMRKSCATRIRSFELCTALVGKFSRLQMNSTDRNY